MNEVLASLKKRLEDSDYSNVFDDTILDSANAAFFVLYQLGVDADGAPIHIDADTLWDTHIDARLLPAVKQYVFLKVKLVFDPPATSYVTQMFGEQLSELEYRIKEEARWIKDDNS